MWGKSHDHSQVAEVGIQSGGMVGGIGRGRSGDGPELREMEGNVFNR